MGLQVNIKAEEKENAFVVFDCTGRYSGDNKGGFGGANPHINSVVESVLFVQGPSDTEEYPHRIDAIGALPNKEGIGFEILPVMIGQTDGIESGQYKLKQEYKIELANGVIITKTGYFTDVFIKNIACCVDKKVDTLGENILNDPKQKIIAEMGLLLKGVERQIANGYYDRANQTIDYMKLQCKCSGC